MCFDWFAPDGSRELLCVSGSHSPDLGDRWRYGCPKSPDWDSDADSWTQSEGTSSKLREHSVESHALQVIEQSWSGEKISFFLGDWELPRVVLSCHVALGMLCQEIREAW